MTINTQTITFDIPQQILLAAKIEAPQFARELRLLAAVKLYELGRLSSGKAPTTLKPRLREQITAMRKDFALLPLSETGAEIFGELKNQLQTVRGLGDGRP